MLLLTSLYNLRVVYHDLIIDIMSSLVTRATDFGLSDLELELLSIAIDHCGQSLRET